MLHYLNKSHECLIYMSTQCPCDPTKLYQDCCGPLLDGTLHATTPEQLMRSRYTAFTQANVVYLQRTMRGNACKNFNSAATRSWAQQVEWLGLEVLDAPPVPTAAQMGEVEFKAHYRAEGKVQTLHERSQFIYRTPHWFYINDQTTHLGQSRNLTEKKPGRNTLCACGSGNKYKKCCGS